MKRATVLFAIMLLVAGLGWAQQPAAAPAQGAPAQVAAKSPIPDGIIVKVEAKQAVDTKKAKVGDPVKLEVVEDGKDADGKTVKGPDGKPAVPRKTKLTAEVTSAKASSKENREARLSLVVTSATFPNGKTMPFLGVVLGPFKVSSLAGGGVDMAGRGSGAPGSGRPEAATPEVQSGIQGVDVKIDPQLGTVLIAPNNFSLDNGTEFHVRYVDPALHQAGAQQPPAK